MDITSSGLIESQISRRGVLRGAGAGALLLGSGPLFVACRSSEEEGDLSKPVYGGTMTVALVGGSTNDTLDIFFAYSNLDVMRTYLLYDQLIGWSDDATAAPMLAETIETNADASEWTIRLRDGVEFHHGKTLDAEDVMFTLRHAGTPGSGANLVSALAAVDLKNMKRLDARTLRIPCLRPFSTLPDTLVGHFSSVYSVDWTPEKPVGCGPFKFESFTPGKESVFTRHENYWQEGKPYLDEIRVVDVADEVSSINSLRAGEVDSIGYIDVGSIRTVEGFGGKVVVADGGQWNPITMRTDVAPFDDVRVRKAMRMLVDRDQMRELVWGGHGQIGNDLRAIWDPMYNSGIPQLERDVDQARALLRDAGHENLRVTMTTSDLAPGSLKTAQVLAQQALDAGVTIDLQRVSPAELFGPKYTSWAFAQSTWTYYPLFPQIANTTLSSSPYNDTHFSDARYEKLFTEALATPDAAKRREIGHEMQVIEHENTGYIIPSFVPTVSAYSSRVGGIRRPRTGHVYWRDCWIG